jgi:hypothetical protein
MAESEVEARLEKKIAELQREVNTLSAQLRRLHGEITHPSVLARIRRELTIQTGDLVGTVNQVTVTRGEESVLRPDGTELSLPQDIHTEATPKFTAVKLGKASATVGAVELNNATNANVFTIKSGVSGANLSWTLPIAAPGGAGYIVVCSVAGVLSYIDPATFAPATVDLTTSVTGILPSSHGGTGNGFTKFTGPTTTEKTFTLPNANAVLATVVSKTPVSTGVGTTLMGSANPATNAGWLAITDEVGSTVYIPYWTDEAP